MTPEDIRSKWTAEWKEPSRVPTIGTMLMDGGAEFILNAGDRLLFDKDTLKLSVKRAETGSVELVGVGVQQDGRVLFLTPEDYDHEFRQEVS